jgi:hypothetical protein
MRAFGKDLGRRCQLEDPPNPLKKGASEFKVPLFKGDLGGIKDLQVHQFNCSNTL